MLLKAKALTSRLRSTTAEKLTIIPVPDIARFENSGAASIDLRLGRWFTSLRPTKVSLLDVTKATELPISESRTTKHHYVPFGATFVLHPGSFILGATLEWIRLPPSIGAF